MTESTTPSRGVAGPDGSADYLMRVVPAPEADPLASPFTQAAARGPVEIPPGEFGVDPDRPARMAVLRERILDRPGLDGIPAPEWLVDRMFTLDTLAWVAGEPGAYKSFFTTDLACSVATGRTFWGQRVKASPVLYLVAEGAMGFRARVEAWEQANATRADRLMTLPGTVPVALYPERNRSPEITVGWGDLCLVAADLGAKLIVLDTQARITPTLDENASRDMGMLIEGLELLRAETGACIVTVHHTSKGGSTLRGSGALTGAGETIFMLHKEIKTGQTTPYVKITNPRQKDSRLHEDLHAHPIELGGSVVLVEGPPDGKVLRQARRAAGDPRHPTAVAGEGAEILTFDLLAPVRRAVQNLADEYGMADFSGPEAAETLETDASNVSRRYLTPAVEQGWLTRDGSARATRYRVSPDLFPTDDYLPDPPAAEPPEI